VLSLGEQAGAAGELSCPYLGPTKDNMNSGPLWEFFCNHFDISVNIIIGICIMPALFKLRFKF
jgi:hypothetical protein